MSDVCPICSQTSLQRQHGTEWLSVNCPNCGEFIITDDAKFDTEAKIGKDEQKRALASHAIRNLSARGTQVKVYSSDIDEFLKGSPPSVMEQANNLLNHFAATAKEPGNTIRFTHPEEFTGVTGALSKEGVTALFEFLCESNFLKKQDSNLNAYAYSMTVKGWQHYEELSKQAKDSTKAFMAMKFGEPELDTIVDDIFRPAVLQTGFRLQKLNDEQSAGLIDDQLRVQIRRSRFLIADLTHGNNVPSTGNYNTSNKMMSCTLPQSYSISKFALGLNGPKSQTEEVKRAWTSNRTSGQQGFQGAVEISDDFHSYKYTVNQYAKERPRLQSSDSAACRVGKQGGGTTDTPIPGSQPASAGLLLVKRRTEEGPRAA